MGVHPPPGAEIEARYRALVEAAPDGIVVHRGGVILYGNPAACSVFGAKTMDDLVGQRVMDLVHADDRDLVRARIRQIEEEGRATEPAEIRGVRLDGSGVAIEVTGHRVMYDGAFADQSIVRDISVRKRAEGEAAAQRLARPVVRRIIQTLLEHVPVPRQATTDVGRRLADAPFDSLDDALGAYRAMGLGALRLDRRDGHRYEFVGDDLIERRADASQPTCHLSLSFLEGTLHAMEGRNARGSELRCQSMGHPECRFVLMLKA